MGQKINPIGLRLGINRGWDSTWFAKKKDFGKYLIEDFQIRQIEVKNTCNKIRELKANFTKYSPFTLQIQQGSIWLMKILLRNQQKQIKIRKG